MLAGQFGGPQWQWIPQIGRHLPASWLPSIARRLLHSQWFVRDVVLKRWFLHWS
jgi:hypothetical protein